jgi:lysyl endopeptidase
MNYLKRLAAAVALLFAGGAGADGLARIPQEVYNPPVLEAQRFSPVAVKQGAGSLLRRARSAQAIRLGPLSQEELDELQRQPGKPRIRKIGVNRELRSFFDLGIGSAELEWSAQADGGALGVLPVTSDGAGALRTRLVFKRIPSGTGVRFSGSGSGDIQAGELTREEISRRGNPVWSPVTVGETQHIEIRVVDDAAREQLDFELTAVSHIAASDFLQSQKLLVDVGASAFCNLDVNCFTSPLVQQMADSVAKIVFSDPRGSFLCSGNLLNDTDSSGFVPYFYTAAHCIGSQEAAGSLQSFWFFESTACDSGTAGPFQTRYNGAQLLYADVATDVSLLRLNDQPPAGVVFSGWDPNPLALFADVTSIHHPSGDLKKLSSGTSRGTGDPSDPSGDLFHQVVWSSGITESGSSGSGLYTMDGSSFFLHGGLWGGSSSCFNPGGADLYSRFDLAYPALKVYLDPAVTAPETGAWWNPQESGRGFMIEVQGGSMFMGAFLYEETGRATTLGASGPMNGPSVFQGNLDRYENGQTLTGDYRPPIQIDTGDDISLHFTANDRATLTWPGGTMRIERFRFSEEPRSAGLTPETGWWWNPEEAGRGFALDLQGDNLIFSGYMYDEQGNPIWYWSSGLLDANNLFQGSWSLYAGGQTLTGPYQAPTVIDDNVGAVYLQFLSETSAQLTLPNGRTIELIRYRF